MAGRIGQFRFTCRATESQHFCGYQEETEPDHPPALRDCVENAVEAINMMQFTGTIASPVNNYQINTNFDAAWTARMTSVRGWQTVQAPALAELGDIPDIKPDSLLSRGGIKVAIEAEKSNKKTIWFDIIKILMLVDQQVADFGLLLVPSNYVHKLGEWDLFKEARFYRWCLLRFAKVDRKLISNLAIIGYTQELQVVDQWRRLNVGLLASLKDEARRSLTETST